MFFEILTFTIVIASTAAMEAATSFTKYNGKHNSIQHIIIQASAHHKANYEKSPPPKYYEAKNKSAEEYYAMKPIVAAERLTDSAPVYENHHASSPTVTKLTMTVIAHHESPVMHEMVVPVTVRMVAPIMPEIASHTMPEMAAQAMAKMTAPAMPEMAAPTIPEMAARAMAKMTMAKMSKMTAPTIAEMAAPAEEKKEEKYSEMPVKYKFAYGVEDPHTGDYHSQEEERNGKHVTGQYSLHEADGTIRIVKYLDDGHGFQALVQNQEKSYSSS